VGKTLRKNAEFLLPVIGVVCFFTRHLYLTFRSSLPIGIDGFYYLLQTQSYLKNGYFYFPTDSPLILYFFVLVDRLINSPVLTIKICIIILDLLLLTGIFALVFELTRNYLYAAVALLVLNLSPLYFYFLFEYISQLGALAFLFWGVFFLVKFARSRRWVWILSAALFLTASIFSHRSMIPIILTAILSFLLFMVINLDEVKLNRKYRVGIWLLIALIIIFPAALKLQPFILLPSGWQNEFTIVPHFPSHFASLPEVIILLVITLPLLWLLVYKPVQNLDAAGKYVLGTIALWGLLITLNPFIDSAYGFVSLGGRLRTLACFQVALLLPALVWLVKDHNKRLAWGIAACALPFLVWSFLSPLPRGAQADYLAHREALVSSLGEKGSVLEKGSLVIADHGEQFAVTAVTGLPASQIFPSDEANYTKIYWLLNGIPATLVDDKMQVLFTDKSGKAAVLVQHNEDLKKRLANFDLRRYVLANNPHMFIYLKQSNWAPEK
jgi:hypothetical protein